MKLPGVLAALLCSFLSCPLLSGQAVPASSAPAAAQEVYPDQGYLSPTRYVNRYFGFAFELPADLRLEPIPQPVARDSRIQILQLGGPPPAYAFVSIFALPLRAKPSTDAKVVLRKALDQELFYGVEELHGLSKTMLDGHQFYFYETRRGADQHMALATNLEGHVVVVKVGANNEKAVKELESSFQHVTFVAPAKAREYAGTDAWEYEGPAISSHRLAQLQADPPAKHIDPGKFTGNVYENQSLGFHYRVQPGWILESEGAVQPAIERSRKSDVDQPWMGTGEQELMKICNRTLFSAWAKRPGTGGQLSYDDFGEVTVSAISTACFPGMRFPAKVSDKRSIEDFLLQFGLTHPVLRDMRDAKAFTAGGNVVVYLHGTVAFQVPGDELSRRLSIALAVTSRRGYLLTWFFAAPHDSELKELLEEQIAFDAEPLTEQAAAPKPGGGVSSPASSPPAAPTPAAATASTTQPAATSAQQANTSSGSQVSQATAGAAAGADPAQPDAPAASASPRPSLLRQGETMKDQQIGGKPIPPQKH